MLVSILLCSFMIVTIEGKCSYPSQEERDMIDSDIVVGKTYYVAMKQKYKIQRLEEKCGISNVTKEGNQYHFNATYQLQNGTIGTKSPTFVLNDKGFFVLHEASNGGFAPEFTLIGGEKDIYYIGYSCEDGTTGAWIHYNKRVNGIDEVDSETRMKMEADLIKYGIRPEDLTQVDNTNCNN